MARVATPSTTPLGGYPVTPLVALSAVLALTAADPANFNAVVSTGRELVVVWNSHATTAYTVTIHSSIDRLNRSADITTYSISAQTIAIFGPFPETGWIQSDGTLHIDGSNASLLIGAIILPVF